MSIVDKAIAAIKENDLQSLDDIWTDMILDEHLPLAAFFDIANQLKEIHHADHALLLLDTLAAHYESSRQYKKAIAVYRQTAYFLKDTTDLRKKLADLYRKQYQASTRTEDYLTESALFSADSLFKALDTLDEFFAYDAGQYFFFERYGLGQVIETDPEKREIVIDFEKKKRHFLTLDIARGLLVPIGHEHFLYKKAKHSHELKQLAADHPEEVVLMLLRSMNQPMTAAQIKKHLAGIVEDKNIPGFWERVRKTLEKNVQVRVTQRPQKTYAFVESGTDRSELARTAFTGASPREQYILAEEYSRTMPDVFSSIAPLLVKLGNSTKTRDPGLALDVLLLCTRTSPDLAFNYTVDTILSENDISVIQEMRTPEHQMIVLEHVIAQHQEWHTVLRKLFLDSSDNKLLDQISTHLAQKPDVLRDCYRTIFSFPKQYPHQYRWMLKKMQGGELSEFLQPSFLPRMIDSLEQVKGTKGILNKLLCLECFDGILARTGRDEAERILRTVNSSAALEEYRKKDFERIIQHHHPSLFKKERIEIYTTEAALIRKKQELEHLIKVEIPRNKKEIGRAREFGDLSENFEYKAAREKQGQLMEKVRIIESDLQQVKVIDRDSVDTSRVSVGTSVTLVRITDKTELQYTILGRWDTDLDRNIISNEAPVAQALLGRVCGDRVTIHGEEYEIARIHSPV